MKKVVIISYFFPPCNFVGGERTFAWAMYLNRFGIYPIIITRQWNDGQKDITDAVVKKEIHEKLEGYEVYRLPYKNSLRDFFSKYNDLKIFNFFQKILTFKELVFSNFFIRSLPYSNFYFFAKKLIAEDPEIKMIIASGRPFQSFSIGHKLKKDYPHLIWVPDYRDEWTTHQNMSTNGMLSTFIHVLEAKSELKWSKNADFFLSVSDYWVASISNYIGKEGFTIKNGYWQLNPVPVIKEKEKKLIITYAGSLYPQQDLTIFINAVISLLKNNKSIYVNFVGINIMKFEEDKIKEMVKGFEKNFTFSPRISKVSLRKIYERTDLLLLTGFKGVKGWYPVKLFDYFSTGIPLLLCPSDKDVMEGFIGELDCGFIINDSKSCEIKLLELLDCKINSKNFIPFRNDISGQKYSRLYQSELLGHLLNRKIINDCEL